MLHRSSHPPIGPRCTRKTRVAAAFGLGRLGAPTRAASPNVLRDVERDLVDQILLAVKDALVPQPLPQLDHEPPPVQVALEVEQESLDAPLVPTVVGVRPDRDRGPVLADRAGVDPVRGNEELPDRPTNWRWESRASRRGRRQTPRCPSSSGGRPSSADAALDLTGAEKMPQLARRDVLDERHRPDVEAEHGQQIEVAGAGAAETEVLAGDDHLGADRPQRTVDELLRLEPGGVGRELDDERVRHAELLEELEPALERGQELDLVPERDPRMRVERDDRRRRPRGQRCVDDALVAAVDAVERADRDGARFGSQIGGRVGDVHEERISSAASRSPTPFRRTSTASSPARRAPSTSATGLSPTIQTGSPSLLRPRAAANASGCGFS